MDAIRRRPWILVVVLLGTMVLVDVVLVTIAATHQPIPVGAP